MSSGDPAGALRDWASRAEAILDFVLPAESAPPQRLHAAMRYATLGSGKRMRPLLVYASGQALGAALDQLDHAAAAVELIHAYSLIHDDLPAMDDDALRRGRPTVHIAFDEATAILAGDALQALAFEALANAPLPAERRMAMVRTLAMGAGAAGMAGGQALDLDAVGRQMDESELATMHGMKTGALIRASARLGALAADAPESVLDALDDYAAALGLGFQIRDDLLDVEASSADLGKTAGKDAAAGKPTYVSMLGREGARSRLAHQSDRISAALAQLEGDTRALAALAQHAFQRAR